MNCDEVSFTRHALEQIFSREIPPEAVHEALSSGITVVEYLGDTPFPSTLLLGFYGDRPFM